MTGAAARRAIRLALTKDVRHSRAVVSILRHMLLSLYWSGGRGQI